VAAAGREERPDSPTASDAEVPMERFVIARNDGQFVTPPGTDKSYTTRLEDAWTFASRDEAKKQACPGNETVHDVRDILRAV
jgi:hypothetical protein